MNNLNTYISSSVVGIAAAISNAVPMSPTERGVFIGSTSGFVMNVQKLISNDSHIPKQNLLLGAFLSASLAGSIYMNAMIRQGESSTQSGVKIVESLIKLCPERSALFCVNRDNYANEAIFKAGDMVVCNSDAQMMCCAESSNYRMCAGLEYAT